MQQISAVRTKTKHNRNNIFQNKHVSTLVLKQFYKKKHVGKSV